MMAMRKGNVIVMARDIVDALQARVKFGYQIRFSELPQFLIVVESEPMSDANPYPSDKAIAIAAASVRRERTLKTTACSFQAVENFQA